MLRKILTLAVATTSVSTAFSQEPATTTPTKGELTVSGFVDAYYRFNFANAKDANELNNYTSFTNSQNSFEVGMASLKADYSFGKVSATVDLGFGQRAREFSYAEEEDGILQSIKQAYVTYAPSDKVSFTMGKFGTHIGYELLDPQFNRNYSMSYMFSYGPFSHTGIKADFGLGDHFGLMLGVANPNDLIYANFGKKNFLAQLSTTYENFSAFLNYAGGKDMDNGTGNQVGLTATAKLSEKFNIGYDGTVKFYKPEGDDTYSWWGSALYLNVDPSDKFGLTLRGEYFDDKKHGTGFFHTSIFQTTLSANIKPHSNIIIIPEFRLDSAADPIYFKNNNSGSKSTGTFLLAAIVYF
ncbi:MAG: porin [Chitinophagaceae bacterium]|nr:porin [Chitinophagaceae bacterium]MCW5926519.1 porin [Chitinophagaceae bacterium]